MQYLSSSVARFLHVGFVVAIALTLSGCGFFFGPEGVFRDRGDDYLKAEVTAPIKLPEGNEGERIGQLFVIPKAGNPNVRLPEEFTVPKPASSDRVTEQRNEVKIQKLGERRWIDINNPPGEVWPGVHGFLEERGIALADQNPTSGTLETVWLSLKDDASGADTAMGKDRYRIELEPGLRSNTTEIHVLQMTASGAAGERMMWPSQSTNPDRETWMIKELAAYLAKDNASQASMLAQAIGSSEPRVALLDVPEPNLSMRVDYSRAWVSVNGSLNRDGFHVDNANREQGQWQVTYSTAAAKANGDEGHEEPGIFARVAKFFDFGLGESDEPESYRVLLQQQPEDTVRVTVRDSKGESLPQSDADRLLRRIRANLL
ncbi:MAG TPA: outer membrane protein assembly factor BamC [Pseudomonadales bacterium]|nr:outer membrane protein assembly factor BamC [Pseudomonadales bacterium]